MILKVKKVHPDAKLPTRAYSTDSGMDLYCAERHHIYPGEIAVIGAGIAIELPSPIAGVGYEAQCRPKSGMSQSGKIVILGTIDCGYTGEIGVTILNITNRKVVFATGDKIGQLVIARVELATVEEVNELSDSDRGENGFGSTGTR